MKKLLLVLACGASLLTNKLYAQNNPNVVTTAVPFLLISPDARAGGMADQGVATSPDVNSVMWNTAKLPFIDKKSGLSLSYSPWLENLVSDVNIATLAGYTKLNSKSAVTFNLRYFSLGDVTFRQNADEKGYKFGPNEFNLTGGYSMKLSRRLSAGINIKYIRSQLTDGAASDGGFADSQPGNAIATDISAFYKSKQFDLSGKDAYLTGGINIANVGGKIKYSDSQDESQFLPANMRLGAGLHIDIDNYNSMSFSFETMKLLVPTQPIRENGEIVSGKDPNVGVIEGIFQSFSDSPDGENELQEFTFSLGAEYWYKNQFAFRGGYFYEDEIKGNRQYATLGAGLKLEMASLDVSYLIPTTSQAFSPLQGTLRFSINVGFDAFTSDKEEEAPAKKKSTKKRSSGGDDKKENS